MPPKKTKQFSKKNSITFHLVPRSQDDPEIMNPKASKFVFEQTHRPKGLPKDIDAKIANVIPAELRAENTQHMDYKVLSREGFDDMDKSLMFGKDGKKRKKAKAINWDGADDGTEGGAGAGDYDPNLDDELFGSDVEMEEMDANADGSSPSSEKQTQKNKFILAPSSAQMPAALQMLMAARAPEYAYDYGQHYRPIVPGAGVFLDSQGLETKPFGDEKEDVHARVVPAVPDDDEDVREAERLRKEQEEKEQSNSKKKKTKQVMTITSAISGLELPVVTPGKHAKVTKDFLEALEVGNEEGFEELEDDFFIKAMQSDSESSDEEEEKGKAKGKGKGKGKAKGKKGGKKAQETEKATKATNGGKGNAAEEEEEEEEEDDLLDIDQDEWDEDWDMDEDGAYGYGYGEDDEDMYDEDEDEAWADGEGEGQGDEYAEDEDDDVLLTVPDDEGAYVDVDDDGQEEGMYVEQTSSTSFIKDASTKNMNVKAARVITASKVKAMAEQAKAKANRAVARRGVSVVHKGEDVSDKICTSKALMKTTKTTDTKPSSTGKGMKSDEEVKPEKKMKKGGGQIEGPSPSILAALAKMAAKKNKTIYEDEEEEEEDLVDMEEEEMDELEGEEEEDEDEDEYEEDGVDSEEEEERALKAWRDQQARVSKTGKVKSDEGLGVNAEGLTDKEADMLRREARFAKALEELEDEDDEEKAMDEGLVYADKYGRTRLKMFDADLNEIVVTQKVKVVDVTEEEKAAVLKAMAAQRERLVKEDELEDKDKTLLTKKINEEYRKKERDRWDCESVLSTMSTTDNIPSIIREVRQKKGGHGMIKLSRNTGIPVGIMQKHRDERAEKREKERIAKEQAKEEETRKHEEHVKATGRVPGLIEEEEEVAAKERKEQAMVKKEEEEEKVKVGENEKAGEVSNNNKAVNEDEGEVNKDEDDDEDEDEDDELDKGRRRGKETPAERKARKQAIKQERAEQRQKKKALKEAFKHERLTQERNAYLNRKNNPAKKKV